MNAFLWIYEDRDRGLALIRGLGVRAQLDAAGVGNARYSTTGKGYVLTLDDAVDLAARLEHAGVSYRFKQVVR